MKTAVMGLILLILLLVLIAAIKLKLQTQNTAKKPTISATTAIEPTISRSPDTFQPPLDKSSARVTKKKFGTYVTPQNSPVQPERFAGYHAGVDFEIFPEEKDADVQVHAICDGKLSLKEYASGYGGLAVESCELNNEPVTVIYGHIRLNSITANADDAIKKGDVIGVLGTGYSSETDGERKHLHLGIHKGSTISILGYVKSQEALSDFIDPCLYACHN